jgi:LacI family transcriptional regulator
MADEQPSRATMRRIAEQVGVSIATVSRVINGRPDVSAKTRELVLQAVRDQGLRSGRSLKTGFVGVTVPIVQYEYYALILAGIAEALYERNLRLALCLTRYEHIRERTLVELLVHDASDGGVLITPTESPDELRALQDQGYPFVVVDPREELPSGIPTVSAANVAGGMQAGEHLIGLGHRRIGVITGPRDLVSMEDRYAGFCAALASAGLLPDPELVHRGNLDAQSGRAAAKALLELDDRPTAIFALNDNMAAGALQAARALGLQVPQDVSIVGFDALEPSRLSNLTTVRQPLEEMGRLAVQLLANVLDGQRTDAMRIELATELVVGETTSPAARS